MRNFTDLDDIDGLLKVIADYLFTEKAPRRDEVIEIMNIRPSLKERKSIAGSDY